MFHLASYKVVTSCTERHDKELCFMQWWLTIGKKSGRREWEWQSYACVVESSASLSSCMGRMSVIQYWNSETTAVVSSKIQKQRATFQLKLRLARCCVFRIICQNLEQVSAYLKGTNKSHTSPSDIEKNMFCTRKKLDFLLVSPVKTKWGV